MSALQQLMAKQGKGKTGRGYNTYPRLPQPLPKPRDPVTLPQSVMAVEVDQDDLVGAWCLDPPDEEVQVLHVVPEVEELAYPSWPEVSVGGLPYPQWPGGHLHESVELAYPQWSETGVYADPGPDPDPNPNPNLAMHLFAGKLLGYMKGKARDSQLVMQAQGRVMRRARLIHKTGKWALEKLKGEAGDTVTSPNTSPTPEAKGSAPSYQQDIFRALQKARALWSDKDKTMIKEGPLCDTAAGVGVITQHDVKHVVNKYDLPEPMHFKGIGKGVATQGGDLKVGAHTVSGVIVPNAASSVVPVHDLVCDGGTYLQDSSSATLVDKHGKATHMVPCKDHMYRLPCIEEEHGQDLEAHAGMLKAIKARDEHMRRMPVFLRHWRKGRIPTKAPPELCDDCGLAQMQRGDGVKGPSAPLRELEVGFDIIGPLVESPDGNVYKLLGVCATTGVGYNRGMPNKKAATVLKYVNEILLDLRVAHGHHPDVTMRFHSDDDKSFMGMPWNTSG